MMVGWSTVASPLAPLLTMELLGGSPSRPVPAPPAAAALLVSEGVGVAVAYGDPPHCTHHLPQQLQHVGQRQVGNVNITGALKVQCAIW